MTDRRSRLRRPPALHRPTVPAPDTAAEVLERAPDVSRETWDLYAEGGKAIADARTVEEAPPLRKEQVAKLEALTAVWERQVRLEGPADATLLYQAPPPPPPPRPRAALEVVEPAEVPDDLPAEEAARTPAPVPSPDPGRGDRPEPARVSDWTSRHDPRSWEFHVRDWLARPVPLADVSLSAGPVLDQGTTPPLSVREASACVGMACATAANVLSRRGPTTQTRDLVEADARALYELAQRRDHVHGQDYPGTSVLGGMKAGQEMELWDGYLWGLGGTRDVAQVLLQLRLAVVLGLPWSASLEEPDAHGIIRPGGPDRGGHSLAAVGLRLAVAGRPGPWFELQQSRGTTEGSGGRVFLHHRDLSRLLAGIGEAAVPVPGEVLR